MTIRSNPMDSTTPDISILLPELSLCVVKEGPHWYLTNPTGRALQSVTYDTALVDGPELRHEESFVVREVPAESRTRIRTEDAAETSSETGRRVWTLRRIEWASGRTYVGPINVTEYHGFEGAPPAIVEAPKTRAA
jgi:hypothetical protein